MASETLHVIARMKAKPERIEELRTLLVGLLAPTHKDAGCIKYVLLENQEDPGQFTFVEEWTDTAALEAHLATDHLQQALKVLPDLLAGELELGKYRLVG